MPRQMQRFATRLLQLLAVIAVLPWVATTPIAYAASTPIKVNFQSAEAALPAGYLRDSGEAFGPRAAADQGAGAYSYGWVGAASRAPQEMTTQGRERGQDSPQGIDQRFDTLVHMQPAGAPAAAWEIAVAPGSYDVIVGVGDALNDPSPDSHSVRVEGTSVIANFAPSGLNGTFSRHRRGWAKVNVTDGRLTIDAQGGVNTKINYIDIQRVEAGDKQRPGARGVTPANNATNVRRDAGVLATIIAPNGGLEGATVNAQNVRLVRLSDGAPVPFSTNTSGGGDVISIQPSTYLDPSTQYVFEVTDGVKDAAGIGFKPFYSVFTTGTTGGPVSGSAIAFKKTESIVRGGGGEHFSSLAIGPDGKLYAATLEGRIYRYTIAADGRLGAPQTINTVRDNDKTNGPRAIIGLAFDPAATATNLILWVSHNGRYDESAADLPDWTGRIARLSGANLENFQNYVINLPHAAKDHMSNSLAFGPDGKLYLVQGSNSAMGAPDTAWANRPERLLSASVLQINTTGIISPPLNVKTEEGGRYNPWSSSAPVQLYATGVRNAYDLVWHSNGKLYVPTNGSAAGGNTPGVNGTLPTSCNRRINGKAYTAPKTVPGLMGVQSQKDWLFRVERGGYYGHPNPLRCEWVMNGGNPTGGKDRSEVPEYPVGTAADPNFRGASFDFGLNKSPNGAIEYKSDAFGGLLKGKLLVVRYSQRDDIIVLTPGRSNGDISEGRENLPGMSGFNNPLDIIENRANGDLYVIEFGPPSTITLLRPIQGAVAEIDLVPDRTVTNDLVDGADGPAQAITIRNTGSGLLRISDIALAGTNADQFRILGTKPTEVPAGDSRTIQVAMNASSVGVKTAVLQVRSNARSGPVAEVALRGLGAAGAGAGEPSLQQILDTYQIAVDVGDPNPNDSALPPTNPLGEEVGLSLFERSDNQLPVTIEPLAVFGPTSAGPVMRFGWYEAGKANDRKELFSVSNDPPSNGQRLSPVLKEGAQLTFDPGTDKFGLFSSWTFFNNRTVFSQDNLNSWEPVGANRHKMRAYPLKTTSGVVPNAYVVAFEEHVSDYDYQDVVVIVRNVKSPPPPTAPVAIAGDDQSTNVGVEVLLNGQGSDVNNDPLEFSWRQPSGPSVLLTVVDGTARFTPRTVGVYTFELTARDPGGLSDTDEIVVTVVKNGPVANAGADQTAIKGQTVMLAGSGSHPEGAELSFSWRQVDGPSVPLRNANTATASFTPEKEGEYRFDLTVRDPAGVIDSDSMVVQVRSAPPTANAGPDKLIDLGDRATLEGSGSNPDGGAVSYKWEQVGGPSVALSSATAAQPNFTAPNGPAALIFRVTVRNVDGATASDETTITVADLSIDELTISSDNPTTLGTATKFSAVVGSSPASDVSWSFGDGGTASGATVSRKYAKEGSYTVTISIGKGTNKATMAVQVQVVNLAPTADAGRDQKVGLGALVALSGIGDDPDGHTPLSYKWDQVGGTAVTLQRNSGGQLTFRAPAEPTVLAFRLTVTDAAGKQSSDEVLVTVVEGGQFGKTTLYFPLMIRRK
jgi:chitodextrinase